MFVIFLATIIVLYSAKIPSLDPCEMYKEENGTLPAFDDDSATDDDGVCIGEIVPFTSVGKTLANMSIFIFAFTCHQNIFSVVSELNPSTMYRIDKVVVLSIGSALLLYLIVAWCGYFTYGDEVQVSV